MTLPAIPPASMTLLASLVMDEEAYRADSYWDPIGNVWTQGYGFTFLANGSRVTQHSPPLSVAECQALLQAEMLQTYLPPVIADCGWPLTAGQLAALGSLSWNCGPNAIEKSSIPGLARKAAWSAVRAAFQVFVHDDWGDVVPALVGRRYREGCILMGAAFLPGKRTGEPLGTPTKPPLPPIKAHSKPLVPMQAQLHSRPPLAAVRAVVSPAQSTAPDPADLLNAAELATLTGA